MFYGMDACLWSTVWESVNLMTRPAKRKSNLALIGAIGGREALQPNIRQLVKLEKRTESRNPEHRNPMAESAPMLD